MEHQFQKPEIWNFSKKELVRYIRALIHQPLSSGQHLSAINRQYRQLITRLERYFGKPYSIKAYQDLNEQLLKLRQDEAALRKELQHKKKEAILNAQLQAAQQQYHQLSAKIHKGLPRSHSAQELISTLAFLEGDAEQLTKKKMRLFRQYLEHHDRKVQKTERRARLVKDDWQKLKEQQEVLQMELESLEVQEKMLKNLRAKMRRE